MEGEAVEGETVEGEAVEGRRWRGRRWQRNIRSSSTICKYIKGQEHFAEHRTQLIKNIQSFKCLTENTPNYKRIQQYRKINSNLQALQCQNELYKLLLNGCIEELDEILHTSTNYDEIKTESKYIEQITSLIIKGIEKQFKQKDETTSKIHAENFIKEYKEYANSTSIRDRKNQAEIDSLVITLRKEWKDEKRKMLYLSSLGKKLDEELKKSTR